MGASEKDQFRIVIVGGGVAGLTLANALEQAGVDYVLLERRDEVAPQVGASIGVFPNGARVSAGRFRSVFFHPLCATRSCSVRCAVFRPRY
ncbi:hypothetical protein L209DRAFT_169644 [Thermothelomyces heterothallicus CBS 203.75]